MDRISENIGRGIFKIEDARVFLEMWGKATFKEDCERIWEAYRWKLLIPIMAGEERIVILGILNERGGACDGEWLRRDVQRLYPIRPVIYELAIEFLVKDGYIARRKLFFGDRYRITEKGQVAALLTHGIYQEITKRRNEHENTR
jgi:DNA-binding PadR family transcriptional regulator